MSVCLSVRHACKLVRSRFQDLQNENLPRKNGKLSLFTDFIVAWKLQSTWNSKCWRVASFERNSIVMHNNLVIHAFDIESLNTWKMLSEASDLSSEYDEDGKAQRKLTSQNSTASNISARRLLIRVIKESPDRVDRIEASMRREWTMEIEKLTKLNEQAATLIVNIESNLNRLCVICQDREKSVVLMPCRHMCLCAECSNHSTVNSCPQCRTVIARKICVFVWSKISLRRHKYC